MKTYKIVEVNRYGMAVYEAHRSIFFGLIDICVAADVDLQSLQETLNQMALNEKKPREKLLYEVTL